MAIVVTAAATFLAGCSAAHKPTGSQYENYEPSTNPESSQFVSGSNAGQAPDELMSYEPEHQGLGSEYDDLEVKAVRDAGRRLGATAGYNRQAEALYKEIENYDPYLSKIFNFQTLLLPEGVIPPVIAQTDEELQHESQTSKTIRARVYKTQKDAAFVNPRPPSWRSYLNLTQTGIEKPLPQLQNTIEKHHNVWERAVQEGWERGHKQARQDFEIAINELERDFLGMQLFHMLWVAEMVEAPKVVSRSSNIEGGGPGSDEMSVGVSQFLITEDVYFINDSSQWNAIIAEATQTIANTKAGLSDIVEREDNTANIPSAYMDNDLSGR
jgi:defect-in-organelle-trafficking protein DotC